MKEKHKIDKIKTPKQISKEYEGRVKVNNNITDNKNPPGCESNLESYNKFNNIKMYGEFVYKSLCDIVYNNFYIVTSVSMMVSNIKSSSFNIELD